MSKKNKTNANEQAKAIAEFKKMKKGYQEKLDKFPTIHQFAIKSECLDKDGNKTKVLIIDTDKKGYIGKFLQLGNPYSVYADEDNKDVKTNEDGEKLAKYVQFMANIDLEENAEAIGLQAMAQARNVVSDFFSLVLVSAMKEDTEMAS